MILITSWGRGEKWYVLLCFLLLHIDAQGKEWSTDHFSIHLPDEMEVEVGEDRLFAQNSGEKYFNPPILIIESKPGKHSSLFIKSFNDDVKNTKPYIEINLIEEVCLPRCVLYSGQIEDQIEGETVLSYVRILESQSTTFYLAYMSQYQDSDNVALIDDLVFQLANQF